jgi:hypothetical protein
VKKEKEKRMRENKEMDDKRIEYDGWLWGGLSNGCRDEKWIRSDRIIPFSHPHPYFFRCGAKRILHEYGYKCRFFRMSEMVWSRIGVEVDAN